MVNGDLGWAQAAADLRQHLAFRAREAAIARKQRHGRVVAQLLLGKHQQCVAGWRGSRPGTHGSAGWQIALGRGQRHHRNRTSLVTRTQTQQPAQAIAGAHQRVAQLLVVRWPARRHTPVHEAQAGAVTPVAGTVRDALQRIASQGVGVRYAARVHVHHHQTVVHLVQRQTQQFQFQNFLLARLRVPRVGKVARCTSIHEFGHDKRSIRAPGPRVRTIFSATSQA